jgi:hypothetical protein
MTPRRLIYAVLHRIFLYSSARKVVIASEVKQSIG